MKTCFTCDNKIRQGMYCKSCLENPKKDSTHAYFRVVSKKEYEKRNEKRR